MRHTCINVTRNVFESNVHFFEINNFSRPFSLSLTERENEGRQVAVWVSYSAITHTFRALFSMMKISSPRQFLANGTKVARISLQLQVPKCRIKLPFWHEVSVFSREFGMPWMSIFLIRLNFPWFSRNL